MTLQPNGGTLRVAVPNKGSLSQAATEMLRESGYRQRQDAKELTLVDAENGVEFYYLRPRDIALYVGVVRTFLEDRGIDASVVRLDGAVETSVRLGVADVIADVVETGSTLRQAGLEVFGETILDSEAVLIARGGEAPAGLEVFKRRLEGVLVARTYVMMDYDITTAH